MVRGGGWGGTSVHQTPNIYTLYKCFTTIFFVLVSDSFSQISPEQTESYIVNTYEKSFLSSRAYGDIYWLVIQKFQNLLQNPTTDGREWVHKYNSSLLL